MNTYDAVVIGGGVIGTSVAYHLSSRGMKVALIEKNDLGSGTSSHCDAYAMLTDKQPGFDTALGFKSICYLKELSERFSCDFEFRQRGSLWVCESEAELQVARDYIERQIADGYPVHMVDRQELHDREPNLAEDLPGGYWSSACAGMNPYQLCFAFAEEGRKLGLDWSVYETVRSIGLDENHKVSAVVTDKRTIHTNLVVNCAGVWAPEIGRMVGVDIPILPRKGVILLSEPTPHFINQKVQEFGYMASKFGEVTYERKLDPEVEKQNVSFTIEQTPDHNLMIGSSRKMVDGYDCGEEIETVQAMARRAIRFFPKLREINCMRTYAGVRPFVPDHFPIVSAVEKVPGFYIAAGHEGEGISLSAITGKLISQLIFQEEPEIEISHLRFSRFGMAGTQ